MQQIRKKNASPAARKKPLSAKKRENAPRMASIGRGSEQAAHQASVHLDRRAGDVRGALGGEEDDDVGKLLGGADASQRNGGAALRQVRPGPGPRGPAPAQAAARPGP